MKNKSIILCTVLSIGIALSAIGQSISVVKPEESGLSLDRLESIDRVLNEYVDQGEVAGGVALIARKGQIGYLKAFGMKDIDSKDPMKTDDLFRIASMTKAITVAGVMMLFEGGYFTLDDPLSKFIPEFSEMQVMVEDTANKSYTLEKAKSQITIRHLLTHTSGLTYDFFSQPYISEIYTQNNIYNGLGKSDGTIGDMVKRLAKLPLMNHPGEGWQYGMNMDVLGYLIEIISGQTFDAYLRDKIFEPLQMNNTHFYLPKKKKDRIATLYGIDSLGRLIKLEGIFDNGYHSDVDVHESNKSYFSGGAGLVSTAEDYYKFLQMILNYGFYKDKKLLSRKTIELMTSEQTGDNFNWFKGYGFGFGLAISRGPMFTGNPGSEGTYSWAGYFASFFWVDPQEELIGILLTQLNPNKNDMNVKFKNLMYQAIDE
jgi:CubicO group peptidase (beta-lactamase class C family)